MQTSLGTPAAVDQGLVSHRTNSSGGQAPVTGAEGAGPCGPTILPTPTILCTSLIRWGLGEALARMGKEEGEEVRTQERGRGELRSCRKMDTKLINNRVISLSTFKKFNTIC